MWPHYSDSGSSSSGGKALSYDMTPDEFGHCAMNQPPSFWEAAAARGREMGLTSPVTPFLQIKGVKTPSNLYPASTAAQQSSPAEASAEIQGLRRQICALETVSHDHLTQEQKTERRASAGTAGPRPEGNDNLWAHEQSRRVKLAKSMVFRRLEEKLGESPEELHRAVLKVLTFLGGAEIEGKVVSIRRVGDQVGRPVVPFAGTEWLKTARIVIVEFRDVESKMAVKQQSWCLAKSMHSGVSLDHAITVEQQRLRAAQWPLIQEAKAKGQRWWWSDVVPHRLLVSGVRVSDSA